MYTVVEAPRFSHPFTSIISGCTRSGKTEWTKKFVENAAELIYPPPEEIIWAYSEFQPGYKCLLENPKVRLVEGIPDIKYLRETAGTPKLLILDDLMLDADSKKSGVVSLFIKGCHHWNISIMHLVQNLFFGGLRTARINSHYIVLMRNPSDKLQVSNLARQLFPGQQNALLEAYKDATAVPYGYLLIDMSPELPEELRLRTKIFPGEYTVVYIPKR